MPAYIAMMAIDMNECSFMISALFTTPLDGSAAAYCALRYTAIFLAVSFLSADFSAH